MRLRTFRARKKRNGAAKRISQGRQAIFKAHKMSNFDSAIEQNTENLEIAERATRRYSPHLVFCLFVFKTNVRDTINFNGSSRFK